MLDAFHSSAVQSDYLLCYRPERRLAAHDGTASGQGSQCNTVRAAARSPGDRCLVPCRDRVSKILVVEDDPSLRALLKALLEDAGYEVVEAGHGQAALDLMQDGDLPDVVTTELMMAVMGGNDLIPRMRSEPRTALVPILVISANARAAEGL